MEKTVHITGGVSVAIDNMDIRVKGPKGELSKSFSDPHFKGVLSMEKKDDTVIIKSTVVRKEMMSMVGTIAAHLRNMMTGVTDGFRFTMKVYHVHFPVSITIKDDEIQIKNFLGEKTLRKAYIKGKVDVKSDKESIVVSGINLEDVGQTCANIENATKLSRRDRRIFQDGIYVTEKALGNGKLIK